MSKYPKLDEYIKKAKTEGKTEDQLRVEMKSAGYNDKDVEDMLLTFQDENSNNKNINKPKSNKKILISIFVITLLLILGGSFYFFSLLNKEKSVEDEYIDFLNEIIAEKTLEEQFQHDADIARLNHLVYWTGLIEEYYDKNGVYPLQENINDDRYIYVNIVNSDQQQYFDEDSDTYIESFNINTTQRFNQLDVSDFVNDIEKGLGREIDEYYDIQLVPSKDLIGYEYFVGENDEYLFYVTCVSLCGDRINYGTYDSEIATLVVGDDFITPSVNVGTGSFLEINKVFKRDDLLNNELFKSAIENDYLKEGFVEERVGEYVNDSDLQIVEKNTNNYKNDSADYDSGEKYEYRRNLLINDGWEPVIEEGNEDSKYPEMTDCGSGWDIVCRVEFKKGDANLSFMVGPRSREDREWVVIGIP